MKVYLVFYHDRWAGHLRDFCPQVRAVRTTLEAAEQAILEIMQQVPYTRDEFEVIEMDTEGRPE